MARVSSVTAENPTRASRPAEGASQRAWNSAEFSLPAVSRNVFRIFVSLRKGRGPRRAVDGREDAHPLAVSGAVQPRGLRQGWAIAGGGAVRDSVDAAQCEAMMTMAPRDALTMLWAAVGGDRAALDRVTLTGAEPALPSSFAVGTLAQAALAATGLAAAEIHRLRTGATQTVTVDMRHAAAEFRSERYLQTNAPPAALWDPLAGLYRTGDGGWLRVHTNFPHHRDGLLALLGCAPDREAVQQALLAWDGEDFESAAAEANLVVTKTRTLDEWERHPQGLAVASLPWVEVIRVADSLPRPLPAGERPLSGVRVVELTRIIAGPVAGRTLAAHGATVLHITSPKLPSIPALVIDTGRGKRPAFLDLDRLHDQARLAQQIDGADIFVQGYRPGALAARGFDCEQLARRIPGLITVSLSAYGHRGPWAQRRGFDSLTQNANGLNIAEAQAAAGESATVPGSLRPKELPAQVLDHGAGYLLALGAMIALLRRSTEGGSWLVRTSLSQVGEWLKQLGRVEHGLATPDPTREEIAALLEDSPSGFGPLRAVRHAALLSRTPARWTLPSMPLGSYPAEWPQD